MAAQAPYPLRVAWLAGQDYAHRGLHDATIPENSPQAFAAAIARGMGIECDVQRTADGEAVVFHDWDLDRLTDASGPVAERTAADLATIPLAGNGQPIPRLSSVLEQIAGRVPLLIEVKSKRDLPVEALCAAVHRDLKGYAGHCAVMSFDPRVAFWFARHSPHRVRGLVVTEEGAKGLVGHIRRWLAFRLARPDFLAYDIRDLPSAFPTRRRARGVPVLTWTVRSPDLRARAAIYADAPIAEGDGLA